MRDRLKSWPRLGKQASAIALDLLLALLATWLAFSLRLETLHWPGGLQWWIYALAPTLAIPVFVRLGLYRAIFRYTDLAALMAVTQAVGAYAIAFFLILFWQHTLWASRSPEFLPRSLGILQPLIFLLLVGSSRLVARFWLAGGRRADPAARGRLLIYGAGDAGVQTAAAIANARQFVLVGFVDDDPAKAGRSINGVTVYPPHSIRDLVERSAVSDILLALPSATRARRNDIIASLSTVAVHIRTLPGMSDLASGRVSLRDFTELDIEDLLGRNPVAAQSAVSDRSIADQVVLVTGAGGSIGSELCRQIVRERPRQLLLLDHSEFSLYSIHRELQALCLAGKLQVDLLPLLGSVANPRRLGELLGGYRPHWVYHAAAYKHVPMVESNPAEGILNNVFGTLNLARAAMDAGVANLVLVSTDKAVRPANVMGASKRMAELVLQAMAQGAGPTRFCMVRFGNVLGSSGSVVPLFRSQLALGGPLTVTHPDVTRYFMTIPEAAQLVLHAGAMAHGGEVFVLDMGEPVKVMQLARRMIELSGLRVRDAVTPDGDIAIAVTGLRPGEKLYEELLIGDNPLPTAHPRILKAQEEILPLPELMLQLDMLRLAADNGDVAAMKSVLRSCVRGYAEPASQTN